MTTSSREQPPFAVLLGVKLTLVTPDRVEGELVIRPELGNRNGVAHGGAIMTFADNLAGVTTIANLPEDKSTTTIESKTNFFAAIPPGDTARGICVPIHRGRTTTVLETRIMRSDGRLAALIIQTQMTIPAKG